MLNMPGEARNFQKKKWVFWTSEKEASRIHKGRFEK